MGEYIKYKGQSIKIGTCEDLYYARYGDLSAAIALGLCGKEEGNSEPSEYVDEKNKFRYRFPFPDEDGIGLEGNYDYYDRGITFELYDAWSPKLIETLKTNDFEHFSIHQDFGGQPGWNASAWISVPCLYSDDWKLFTQANVQITRHVVLLKQQRLIDGELWVVVACPYCGSKIRLDYELAVEFSNSILGSLHPDRVEISSRIFAGYNKHKTYL